MAFLAFFLPWLAVLAAVVLFIGLPSAVGAVVVRASRNAPPSPWSQTDYWERLQRAWWPVVAYSVVGWLIMAWPGMLVRALKLQDSKWHHAQWVWVAAVLGCLMGML